MSARDCIWRVTVEHEVRGRMLWFSPEKPEVTLREHTLEITWHTGDITPIPREGLGHVAVEEVVLNATDQPPPERETAGTRLQAEIGAWADETFPTASVQSILWQIYEEVGALDTAVRQAPMRGADPIREEAADVALALFHLAHKQGFDLRAAVEDRLAENKARVWELHAGEKGYWKHEVGG
jgi:NTP pyrophosphatase (non-canonical NTP hydrolase)